MTSQGPESARRLPDRPSKENLKKQAKARAKERGVQLAVAQFELAHEYGFANWAALMRAVDAALGAPAATKLSQLSTAARAGDVEQVRALLAQGADADGDESDADPPLFHVCDSDAPADQRLTVVQALLEAGAFVRNWGESGATSLHAAARRGPASIVRLLLKSGSLAWQGDRKGKPALKYAQQGAPQDRDEILWLLKDGPRITDPNFQSAVEAIQSGDASRLSALLDAHPSLLTDRALEPDLGQRGYFSDPALFWFIANNPTLQPHPAENIVEIAELMLARGVKQEDKDYALGLVVTNNNFLGTQQLDLVRVLVEAGAKPGGMLGSLGHGQRAPAAWLVDNGYLTLTAPIAAGLGRVDVLPAVLAASSAKDITDALGMAVINREAEAARLCLEAGADPNRFMACHTHSTPTHQAALTDDVTILELLIAHGARTDIRDTLWRGTPLGWARHGKNQAAEAFLLGVMTERGEIPET